MLDQTSITADGRREAFLSVGAVQSVGEVERVAGFELANVARSREKTTVEYHARTNGETPYIGFRPGDSITIPDFVGAAETKQVISVAVVLNVDGTVEYTPELGDTLIDCDLEARVTEQARKMTPGTLAGESKTATPASPQL